MFKHLCLKQTKKLKMSLEVWRSALKHHANLDISFDVWEQSTEHIISSNNINMSLDQWHKSWKGQDFNVQKNYYLLNDVTISERVCYNELLSYTIKEPFSCLRPTWPTCWPVRIASTQVCEDILYWIMQKQTTRKEIKTWREDRGLVKVPKSEKATCWKTLNSWKYCTLTKHTWSTTATYSKHKQDAKWFKQSCSKTCPNPIAK